MTTAAPGPTDAPNPADPRRIAGSAAIGCFRPGLAADRIINATADGCNFTTLLVFLQPSLATSHSGPLPVLRFADSWTGMLGRVEAMTVRGIALLLTGLLLCSCMQT